MNKKEWIEKNISKTDFKDIESANFEYDQLVANAANLIEQNKNLFERISKATKDEVFELVKSETEIELKNSLPGNVVNSPCTDGCFNGAVGCQNDANHVYATVVGGAWWEGATPAGWGALVGGAIVHHIMLRACVRTLMACYGGC